MKKIEVKLLTPSEVSEIVALDQICLGGLWKEDAYQREIESDQSTLLILLLHSESSDHSEIIGMGCLWSIVNEAHITLLAIHADYRRQGLGQLLLFDLLEDAITRNLEWATLEVNVNNVAAINLYQKFGFEIVGTRKGYYQATGEDALILWRKDIQLPEFRHSIALWQQELGDRLGQNQYRLNIS